MTVEINTDPKLIHLSIIGTYQTFSHFTIRAVISYGGPFIHVSDLPGLHNPKPN